MNFRYFRRKTFLYLHNLTYLHLNFATGCIAYFYLFVFIFFDTHYNLIKYKSENNIFNGKGETLQVKGNKKHE